MPDFAAAQHAIDQMRWAVRAQQALMWLNVVNLGVGTWIILFGTQAQAFAVILVAVLSMQASRFAARYQSRCSDAVQDALYGGTDAAV